MASPYLACSKLLSQQFLEGKLIKLVQIITSPTLKFHTNLSAYCKSGGLKEH